MYNFLKSYFSVRFQSTNIVYHTFNKKLNKLMPNALATIYNLVSLLYSLMYIFSIPLIQILCLSTNKTSMQFVFMYKNDEL